MASSSSSLRGLRRLAAATRRPAVVASAARAKATQAMTASHAQQLSSNAQEELDAMPFWVPWAGSALDRAEARTTAATARALDAEHALACALEDAAKAKAKAKSGAAHHATYGALLHDFGYKRVYATPVTSLTSKGAFSSHWSPYDRVGVVNADP